MSVPVCPREVTWRMGSGGARFLSVTTEHFTETGEWPSLDTVQKLLAQNKDLSDVRRRAKRLPRSLGRRDRKGLVVLSVRGIHKADPNEPLLRSFVASLIWITRGYLGKEGRSQNSFSEQELVESVGLSAPRAEQVMALFGTEGLVAPRPADSSAAARAIITSRILPYLYVGSVGDYLRKRKKEDRKRWLKRSAVLPCRLARWFKKEDTSIAAKVVVAVLAAVIAAVLLTFVFKLGPAGSKVPNGQTSATGHPASAPSSPAAGRR